MSSYQYTFTDPFDESEWTVTYQRKTVADMAAFWQQRSNGAVGDGYADKVLFDVEQLVDTVTRDGEPVGRGELNSDSVDEVVKNHPTFRRLLAAGGA